MSETNKPIGATSRDAEPMVAPATESANKRYVAKIEIWRDGRQLAYIVMDDCTGRDVCDMAYHVFDLRRWSDAIVSVTEIGTTEPRAWRFKGARDGLGVANELADCLGAGCHYRAKRLPTSVRVNF